MIDNEVKKALLTLVRLGIGHPVEGAPEVCDWPAIKTLAAKHGLTAIVLDGIETLQAEERPNREILMQWIGEVMKGFEKRRERYLATIAELAAFYNSHGFKMMTLKGLACSLDWPRPEHRSCGDIDIWQFGMQKEADALVEKEKGIKITTAHQHHTEFHWNGFLVENHYDFINVHHHRSNAEFERLLKELAAEENIGAEAPDRAIGSVEVKGERVYMPSANLHTLFVLKHLMLHFASERIILRQLLDWGFHVKAHTGEIDWPWVLEVLERFGMVPAFRAFNAICVEDLGFDANIFPAEQAQCDAALKERVLNEILSPEFEGEAPKALLKRVAFKLRRWKANAWKHRLCYKDSMWSAFWSGVWNHLLKPKSI
ncbi:MAG: nucleotidyltransferase family protein [Bacteroidales bacterium]|nr:nucleotidyltransferase family protein [Bacteroidales bacterium]